MEHWLETSSVCGAIWEASQNREVKFTVHPSDESDDYGYRHSRFSYSGDVPKWLRNLHWPNNDVSIFIGTNLLDWKQLKLPPRLRLKGKSGYNKEAFLSYGRYWKAATRRDVCEEHDIDWDKIWKGKNMVWDIDHEEYPLTAFSIAYDIAEFLKNQDVTPQIVFSGSKGFHVWLNPEDSKSYSEKLNPDLWNLKDDPDPLQTVALVYKEVVSQVYEYIATEEISKLDLAPCQRQGIIRCPYSVHPKTAQVVWPLEDEEIKRLRDLVEFNAKASIEEISKTIHKQGWIIENQSSMCGFRTYLPAQYGLKVWKRGFPMWHDT